MWPSACRSCRSLVVVLCCSACFCADSMHCSCPSARCSDSALPLLNFQSAHEWPSAPRIARQHILARSIIHRSTEEETHCSSGRKDQQQQCIFFLVVRAQLCARWRRIRRGSGGRWHCSCNGGWGWIARPSSTQQWRETQRAGIIRRAIDQRACSTISPCGVRHGQRRCASPSGAHR